MAYLPYGTRFRNEKMFLGDPMKLKNFELIQIGESFLEPNFEIETHSQFCYEISYVISGSGYFYTNGEKTAVTSGDVIFTPKNGTHRICSAKEKLFYSYIGFNFNPESNEMPPEITEFFESKNDFVIHSAEDIYINYKNCINEICYNASPQKLLVESYLLEIIFLTYRLSTAQSTDFTQIKNDSTSKQLTYIIRKYVEENIFKNISVNEIARDLGYSVCHISHVFSNQMDIPLKKYISDCKIKKAKELIKTRQLTVTEISEMLGFLNLQSFSRTFLRETGMYPKEYVKSHALKENRSR